LDNGDSIKDILENYPTLTEGDIYACLKFAADLVERKIMLFDLLQHEQISC
jgi:uncharacterized protein (DUF433 family)